MKPGSSPVLMTTLILLVTTVPPYLSMGLGVGCTLLVFYVHASCALLKIRTCKNLLHTTTHTHVYIYQVDLVDCIGYLNFVTPFISSSPVDGNTVGAHI
jgi:hypothetical protein